MEYYEKIEIKKFEKYDKKGERWVIFRENESDSGHEFIHRPEIAELIEAYEELDINLTAQKLNPFSGLYKRRLNTEKLIRQRITELRKGLGL